MLVQVVTNCASPCEAWPVGLLLSLKDNITDAIIFCNNILASFSASGTLLRPSASSRKSLRPWMRRGVTLPSPQSHLMMGTKVYQLFNQIHTQHPLQREQTAAQTQSPVLVEVSKRLQQENMQHYKAAHLGCIYVCKFLFKTLDML